MQQKFTLEEFEQQQRNSAIKGASHLLFFQVTEYKDFL